MAYPHRGRIFSSMKHIQQLSVIESFSPMKFFEYLAAGLPVVATCITSLKEFSDVALLCTPTVETFSSALTASLAGIGPSLSKRLAIALKHTYATRTQRQLITLEAILAVDKVKHEEKRCWSMKL